MPIDERTHYEWAIRGLGGVVRILEMLVESGIMPAPAIVASILSLAGRLTAVAQSVPPPQG